MLKNWRCPRTLPSFAPFFAQNLNCLLNCTPGHHLHHLHALVAPFRLSLHHDLAGSHGEGVVAPLFALVSSCGGDQGQGHGKKNLFGWFGSGLNAFDIFTTDLPSCCCSGWRCKSQVEVCIVTGAVVDWRVGAENCSVWRQAIKWMNEWLDCGKCTICC